MEFPPRQGKKRNISSSDESGKDFFASDEESEKSKSEHNSASKLLPCKYGSDCYRKNPEHFKSFSHPSDSGNHSNNNRSTSCKSPKRQKSARQSQDDDLETLHNAEPFRFFLLKVSSINHAHNSMLAVGIKGIFL